MNLTIEFGPYRGLTLINWNQRTKQRLLYSSILSQFTGMLIDKGILKEIMILSKTTCKIAILEDSHYYNDILTKQITDFTSALALKKRVTFDVRSYLKSEDFILDMDEDLNILFTDYYLGKHVNAKWVIEKVNAFSNDCSVVIMSQNRNSYTVSDTLNKGADKFIYKNRYALENVCFYIDDYLNNSLRKSYWRR